MRHPTWIVLALLAACSSNNNTSTPDATSPVDAASNDTQTPGGDVTGQDGGTGSDAPRADVPRADASTPTDLGVSSAGNACTTDDQCGELSCEDYAVGGFCTADCNNVPATASGDNVREQQQCGGRGSTCLTFNDAEDAFSLCTRACNPTARTEATGACRAGLVCTGWWYTHEGAEPDATGCDLFCTTDAHCPTGEHCNTRLGECHVNAVDTTRRADGEPCDPTMVAMVPGKTDPENIQCRGVCFLSGDERRQGICGSLINLALGTACPDNPANVHPFSVSDDDGFIDNVGLCIDRECTTNADCTAPLVCVPGEDGDPALCGYGGPGIPAADAGAPDASAPDASVTDAGAPDGGG